ncbi:hypothetical protein Emag_003598 [Eimeria magna]
MARASPPGKSTSAALPFNENWGPPGAPQVASYAEGGAPRGSSSPFDCPLSNSPPKAVGPPPSRLLEGPGEVEGPPEGAP